MINFLLTLSLSFAPVPANTPKSPACDCVNCDCKVCLCWFSASPNDVQKGGRTAKNIPSPLQIQAKVDDVKASPKDGYNECRRQVESGRTMTLAVGVPGSKCDFSTPSLEGIAPGLWKCYPGKNGPVMEPLTIPRVVEQPGKGNGLIMAGIQVGADAITRAKAEIQARAGRCFHPGGQFVPGASAEGCGMASTPERAITCACFWGQRAPLSIAVVQGANGYWHSCIQYR